MGSPTPFEYLRYMIGYLVLAFLVYFLYRFIVGFVLPVVRTANQMKRKVNEMKQPFSGQRNPQQGNQRGPSQVHVDDNAGNKGPFSRFSARKATAQQEKVKVSKSDYIEFEELN